MDMENAILKLADQDSNEEAWRKQRRLFLTSSDLFKFVPEDVLFERGWWVEQWMARTDDGVDQNLHWARQEVMRRKMTGEEPNFGNPCQVHWGRYMEEVYRYSFDEFAGITTEPSHALYHNERWPYLATSIDGWCDYPPGWEGLRKPEMFVNPDGVIEAITSLDYGMNLLEIKTTSDFGIKMWTSGKKTQPRSKIIAGRFTPQPPSIPIYYRPQVLTQMAILDIPKCLVVGHGGMSTMVAYTMEFDPEWYEVLDRINEAVKPQLDLIRSWIDDNEEDAG